MLLDCDNPVVIQNRRFGVIQLGRVLVDLHLKTIRHIGEFVFADGLYAVVSLG